MPGLTLRQPTGPDAAILDRKSSRLSCHPDASGPGGGTLSRRYAPYLHRNTPVWRCIYGLTNTPPDPHTRLRIESERTTGYPHPIDTAAPQSGGREQDRDTRPDTILTDQPDRLNRIDTSRPDDQPTGTVSTGTERAAPDPHPFDRLPRRPRSSGTEKAGPVCNAWTVGPDPSRIHPIRSTQP